MTHINIIFYLSVNWSQIVSICAYTAQGLLFDVIFLAMHEIRRECIKMRPPPAEWQLDMFHRDFVTCCLVETLSTWPATAHSVILSWAQPSLNNTLIISNAKKDPTQSLSLLLPLKKGGLLTSSSPVDVIFQLF